MDETGTATTTTDDNDNDDSHPLDETWYYYQNPTTGTVSSNPLTVRQLCKLLCPIREGRTPILPAHTQCLAIQQQTQQQTQQQQQQQQQTQQSWKIASEWPVLKEASAQWYVSVDGSSKGPMSCRGVLSLEEQQQQSSSASSASSSSSLMVYAQKVTPEWTLLSKLEDLQWVLRALKPLSTPPATTNNNGVVVVATTTTDTKEESQKEETANTTTAATTTTTTTDTHSQEVQDELEAFLSSTAAAGDTNDNDDDDGNDEDEHTYESDGGTKYVKDPMTGNWIHEALAPSPPARKKGGPTKKPAAAAATSSINNNNINPNKKKKKSKKAKFSKRNAKHWIYVTGLPSRGVTEEDLAKYFGKAGLLDLDPESLQPKVKLYKNPNNNNNNSNHDNDNGDDDDDGDGCTLNGDASICYARPESVALALQILDESPWDERHILKVERATFQAKEEEEEEGGEGGESNNNNNKSKNTNKRKKPPVSEAKRKVARLALRQAQDEGFGGRLTGGRKGLRIIVVRNMLEGIPESTLEPELVRRCEEFGTVEKITVIESTKICLLKFAEPSAASDAVRAWHGQTNPVSKRKMHAIYWDGVTDYTHNDSIDETKQREEEAKRIEEFGEWLETQKDELPPELQLRVEQPE
jgi:hypothetical protein